MLSGYGELYIDPCPAFERREVGRVGARAVVPQPQQGRRIINVAYLQVQLPSAATTVEQ